MRIFKSFKIKKIKFKNRFSVASMCQYSADNGNPSSWHYSHLGKLAQSGAGLLMYVHRSKLPRKNFKKRFNTY